MDIDPQKIVTFLKSENSRPKSFKEIKAHFNLRSSEARQLKALLRKMAKAGLVSRSRGRSLRVSSTPNLVVGRLEVHPRGHGLVTPGDGSAEIFIPPQELREAMHKDKVLVRMRRRGEGALAGVVSRGVSQIVGRLEEHRGLLYVIPEDPHLQHKFYIPRERLGEARVGDFVVARISSYPTRHRHPEGEIVRVLGPEVTPEVDAQIVIQKYDLPHQFSPEALAEASACPQVVSEEETAGRLDLRGLNTVTVDPEDAKDYDDAVSIQLLPNGLTRLLVSIADVSHYVRPDSFTDREAYERGTSVYFPGIALTMLPERVSSGICCLHPQADRLSITVSIDFDGNGNRVDYGIHKSIIRSKTRLTYTELKAILDGDPVLRGRYAPLVPDLRRMEELALKLWEIRRRRGSLEFDLPEPLLVLGLDGGIEGIIRVERNIAHRIIEEFMLSANETVASHLAHLGIPFLYRIHEPPDREKMVQLKVFLNALGYDFPTFRRVTPADYQEVLRRVEGSPIEHVIHRFILRTLKQARYSPENPGHFGLAATHYTHFTSPIRRYPDLVIHRILKGNRTIGPQGVDLEEMAQHTSERERVAMEAERDMWELKKARLMEEKVGNLYEGWVTGILPFGFFVELEEIFAEGMVRLDTLADDYYIVDPEGRFLKGRRRGRTIRLGDRVKVRVAGVDVQKREIDLVLVSRKGLDKRR